MDLNRPPPTPRKVKFAPAKIPKSKAKATKIEARDEQKDDDSVDNQALVRLLNEKFGRPKPEAEKESNVQVAFGPGDSPSTLKTYGSGSDKSSGTTSKSSGNGDEIDTSMIDVTDDTTNASAPKIKKEFKEPFDYNRCNYPTTLPLRRPYSGDPEILDEKEFGEDAASVAYDENTVNPAEELGLLDNEENQQKMFLFQLPPLPFPKEPVSRKGKDKIGTAQPKTKSGLDELSGGYKGKMLVYKSGAVKLKLGETQFDVSPGTNSGCVQDVVAIDTENNNFCVLGSISKKAVVTPDLDSIDP